MIVVTTTRGTEVRWPQNESKQASRVLWRRKREKRHAALSVYPSGAVGLPRTPTRFWWIGSRGGVRGSNGTPRFRVIQAAPSTSPGPRQAANKRSGGAVTGQPFRHAQPPRAQNVSPWRLPRRVPR